MESFLLFGGNYYKLLIKVQRSIIMQSLIYTYGN